MTSEHGTVASPNADNAHTDSPTSSYKTVVLLCGLPASGKSTLARKLEDHYSNQEEGAKRLIHLEYDAFEDILFSQQQQGGEEEEEARRGAWNQAREVALQKLEQTILEAPGSPPLLILLDDNFHLRGMRKQIHRILLKYRPIRFGLVWMETPLGVCLERNRKRERKIPEHVISKMHSTFEPPRAAWEQDWINVTDTAHIEDVISFVEQCSEIVDLPEENDPEQQEADRAIILQNQRHSWDKMLRSWVGQVAKYDKQLARGANMARKELLKRMKNPNPEIRDDDSLLESFIDLVSSSSTTADGLRYTLKEIMAESS